jgi:hypothetical protein
MATPTAWSSFSGHKYSRLDEPWRSLSQVEVLYAQLGAFFWVTFPSRRRHPGMSSNWNIHLARKGLERTRTQTRGVHCVRAPDHDREGQDQ